jgi:hypothetical protein
MCKLQKVTLQPGCKNFWLDLSFNVTMRLFTCILSLYILALSVMPCIDVPKDKGFKHSDISQNSNEKSNNENDLCSPFCTCNCCVSPIIYQDYIIQYNTFWLLQEYNSCYTNSFVSSPFAPIWQPPKIS